MADFDAYQTIFDDIKKRLDDPSVIYTLHEKVAKFDPIPSDITVVDEVLNGGLPEGRIIEIFGPEASGKTTLTLHFIAAAQRRGYVVYFIDAEQALETARAICEATEAARQKHGDGIKSLIVIDSIPALVPKQAFETYEKDGFDATVALGSQARMLSQLLPPLVNKAGKAGVTVVFINQERDKIGVTYGSPTTTPGGRAVKFFSSLRLKVARIGWYERGGERAGIRTHMLPIKSKLFPIFGRKAEFIIGPEGINQYAALAETLISKGVVSKKGAWIKVDDLSFQGLPKFEDELRENEEFREELIRRLGELSTQVELKKA